jgi:alkyl hydroperoxide reductase subunit F
LAYCKSVTLLHYNGNPKADQITIDKIKQNPKMKIILNAVTKSVTGDKFVSALQYTDAVTKEEFEIKTEGIFVEIGLVPTTDFIQPDLVTLTDYKTIVTNPRDQQTSQAGIWAAGDCTDAPYHQNNIAAGDAVKALEHIYQYLHHQG